MPRIPATKLAAGIAAAAAIALLVAPAAQARVPKCLGKRATIVGTKRADRIRGTRGPDVIVAGRGFDVVRGRGGNDRICGGSGPDYINGGPGRDRIVGGSKGDNPANTLIGARGNDVIRSGNGATIFGGPGRDRMIGGRSQDTFVGGPGNDYINGRGVPPDTLIAVPPSPGNLVSYEDAQGPIVARLYLGAGGGANVGDDALVNIDSVVGSPFDDTIFGSDGVNVLTGEYGSDTIYGLGGNDLLDGDRLSSLVAAGGTDFGDGGSGSDSCNRFETEINCP